MSSNMSRIWYLPADGPVCHACMTMFLLDLLKLILSVMECRAWKLVLVRCLQFQGLQRQLYPELPTELL